MDDANALAPLLQLTDAQKTQAASAFYQIAISMREPGMIGSDATQKMDAFLDAQAKAKEDALAKIFTPGQLATYHQQAQIQLTAQKAMLHQMMSPASSTAQSH